MTFSAIVSETVVMDVIMASNASKGGFSGEFMECIGTLCSGSMAFYAINFAVFTL